MEQKKNKQLSTKKLMQIFAGDVGKGLFTGMIVNYIVSFYVMSDYNSVQFLPGNKIFGFFTVISFILLLSKVVDAITDPLVANFSDKSKNPKGRRIPLMRKVAIPYALSALMVYMAPFSVADETGRILNAVWVAIFIVLYYTFYTIYSVPHKALIPEIIPNPNDRVKAYTISTVFFMGSSCVCYFADSIAQNSALGYANTLRIVFSVMTIVGLACLLISAYSINEKDYLVETQPPKEPFLKSFKLVLKNKDFMVLTIGDLFNYMAMAFFQTAMFSYIAILLNLGKYSFVILGVAIVTAICLFPLIMKSSKISKKKPILIGATMFTAIFICIYFSDHIFPGQDWLRGIGMAILMAYPFAAINILPQSMVSDVIQLDSMINGANREGIYASIKTFLEKLSYAVAGTFVGSVIVIGSVDGVKAGVYGLQLSGLIAGIFAFLSLITFAFYNDKGIMKYIRKHKEFSGKPLSAKAQAKADKIGIFDRFVISELTPEGELKKKPNLLNANVENTIDTEVTSADNIVDASKEETETEMDISDNVETSTEGTTDTELTSTDNSVDTTTEKTLEQVDIEKIAEINEDKDVVNEDIQLDKTEKSAEETTDIEVNNNDNSVDTTTEETTEQVDIEKDATETDENKDVEIDKKDTENK